ncbi:MAG: hypothetical protein K1X95_07915 [Acidimicrobiia bacterium]|nr:hypothetical protein [Acidimicrobiia bacterium]
MLKKPFVLVALPFLVIGVLLLVVSLFLGGALFWIGLIVSIVVILLGVVFLVVAATSADKPSTKLLASGQQAPATVLELTPPAGGDLNANPQVRYLLGVDGPLGPRQVELTQATPQMFLRKVHEGSVLPVRVDRSNPDVVLIDWARASAVLDGTVPNMDL